MKNKNCLYTIGEIARLYNLGVDAIRYYEQKGLLSPERGENGYRYYSDKSIWRMNVITNLRSLGFSVERIGQYFSNHNVSSTEMLLNEELALIDQRMKSLKAMRKELKNQLRTISEASDEPVDTIRLIPLPARRYFSIREMYSNDEEMDLLIRRLLEGQGKSCMIGNNNLASVISPDLSGKIYSEAILFDKSGDFELPGGNYLSLNYRGVSASRFRLGQLLDYAQKHGLKPCLPYLDIILIDIHTSSDVNEHLYQVQVRIE